MRWNISSKESLNGGRGSGLVIARFLLAVDAIAAGTEGEHHQEAASDRHVLPKVDEVAHARGGVGIGPVGMEEEPRDDAEHRQHECHGARSPADEDEQCDADLHHDGDRRAERWQGQVLRCDIRHRPGEVGDLAEAGQEEERNEQHAPDDSCEVARRRARYVDGVALVRGYGHGKPFHVRGGGPNIASTLRLQRLARYPPNGGRPPFCFYRAIRELTAVTASRRFLTNDIVAAGGGNRAAIASAHDALMSVFATAAPAPSAMSPELDGSLDPLQALILIVETVRVLLWSTEPNGVLRYVNQRVVDYTGRTRKDLVERGWEDLIHPDDRDNVVGAWSHAVRTGGSYQVRHRLRRTDGEYRWFLAQAAPLLDSQGRVIQFFGMNTELAFPPSDYEAEAAPRGDAREADASKPSSVSLSARERTIVLMMGHG